MGHDRDRDERWRHEQQGRQRGDWQRDRGQPGYGGQQTGYDRYPGEFQGEGGGRKGSIGQQAFGRDTGYEGQGQAPRGGYAGSEGEGWNTNQSSNSPRYGYSGQSGYAGDRWQGSEWGSRDRGYDSAGQWGSEGDRWQGSRSGGGSYSGEGRERGMWERGADEVASWFGDRDAERRREMDQHRGRGPKGYMRSDERIREDVCDRLTDDPSVDASEVDVQVSQCEVTLSGTVSSRDQRRRAEECAERVSGVKHVQNNIRVNAETSGSSSGTSGGTSRI